MYYFMYRSFRYNFHGAVCLFSKYFQHLLEGENLYELDINHYHNIDNNIFGSITNFSSNWKGTCNLIEIFNNFKTYYENNISLLNNSIDSFSCSSDDICHKNTKYYYEVTKQKIEQLSNISFITSSRPSGSTSSLMPIFEDEFSDLSNNKTLGGLIYYTFKNILEPNMNKLEQMQNILKNYISNSNLEKDLNNAYDNMINFDKTIASAASIMITNFINNKKMILNFFNFMYLFITSGYMIALVCVFIFLVVFECEKYKCLYYFIIAFLNLLVLLSIWEVVLAGLFQGIRLYCRESPRVMKFLFTEDYIINGNTEDYPPKFGNKDSIQPELFSICLNGNGDLYQKFATISELNTFLTETETIKTKSEELYNLIKSDINDANMLSNPYINYINNSYIYASILRLEEMYNNLYLVSDVFNFGYDNIRNITNTIRTILDNCGMKYEYYVIKKEDCPKYRIELNQITNSIDYMYHCYVIQNLLSGSKASYSAKDCNNDYINTSINFIRDISILLKNRINQLKEIQNNYVSTWNNMYSEINSINNIINNIDFLLRDEINNKYPMGNCSSIKFDLIDFSEFISDKIGYKLKIMIIFSALSGIFGFLLFYCILLIIYKIKSDYFYLYKGNGNGYYYNNYSKMGNYNKLNKIRKIRPLDIKSDDESKLIDNKKKENNKVNKSNISLDINNNKSNIIYNNVRKIEMKNFEKKNE